MPRELARKVHDPLRRYFRDDPGVEVVVEQRGDERRSRQRRRTAGDLPPEGERRRIRGLEGRRVADRRAAALPVGEPPGLPRQARPYADRLVFVQRAAPSERQLEDADTARLVVAFQAGDRDAFSDLYRRYFERVYSYMRVAIGDSTEAEDATQQVFTQALVALPRYERRGQPFRAWLFTIARNHALDQLKKRNRLAPEDPADIDARSERSRVPHTELSALTWITDRDLMLFVERLPFSQRQVLLLRFMLDLTSEETASVLGMTAAQVRSQQRRALRFLEQRLTALGRAPERGDKSVRMRSWGRQARVLRRRRFVLTH